MLKRKIEEYLVEWKERDKKKSLIVEGPQQVGKTASIVDFAKNNYEENHYIYVNFLNNPGMIDVFEPMF